MIILGLLDKWRNRETKARLREENKRLKEQLFVEYKSNIPIFDKPMRITTNMCYCIRPLFSDVNDDEVAEMLAQDFVRVIKDHMIIKTELEPSSGNTKYIATLYIADYEGAETN